MTQRVLEARLVEGMRELLVDGSFASRHRAHEKAFTRQRSLTFVRVMLLVIQKTLRSVQLHLHDFFAALSGSGPLRTVTASAWTQARAKLRHTAFIELSQKAIVEPFYASAEGPVLWRGHRLLALDGSVIRLPQQPELFAHFGGQQEIVNQKGPCGGELPLARLSVLYDCLNRLVLDAQVGQYTQGEHALSRLHLRAAAAKGDVVLADRGYASYLLLAEFAARGMDFVVRCKQQFSAEVAALFERNEDGVSLTVTLSARSRRKEAKAAGLPLEMKVRFVSVRLPTGELEVLVTSLLDEQAYPSEEFLELYHLRWGIETFFGLLKGRLSLENFSGLTVEAVLQDIHSTILLTNLESVLTREAAKRLPQPETTQERRRHRKKINRAVSFHALKGRVLELLLGSKPVEEVLEELTTLFLSTPVSVRPERAQPRKPTVYARLVHYLKHRKKHVF